jgi:hypothetical protein
MGVMSGESDPSKPEQAQMRPMLIGAFELLAPAACGPATTAVALKAPHNNTTAKAAANLRSNVFITVPPLMRALFQLGVVLLQFDNDVEAQCR